MTDRTVGILRGVRYHRESGLLLLRDGGLLDPFACQWVTHEVHVYAPERRLGRYRILVLDEREVSYAREDGSESFVETFVKFFYRFWPE